MENLEDLYGKMLLESKTLLDLLILVKCQTDIFNTFLK